MAKSKKKENKSAAEPREILPVITVYCFNAQTKEFTGTSIAQRNPMRPGTYLMPKNTTQTAPPEAQSGKLRVWTGEAWSFQDIPEVVIPQKTTEVKAAEARSIRNSRLVSSDWTQLADVPEWVDQQAWQTYRQALRDVPQQGQFPNTINWPSEPVRS